MLDLAEYPGVEFRDCASGREAFVVGSSLAVWEIVMLAHAYQMDLGKLATHLGWTLERATQVMSYAEAHPAAVEAAIADNDAATEERLRTFLPHYRW